MDAVYPADGTKVVEMNITTEVKVPHTHEDSVPNIGLILALSEFCCLFFLCAIGFFVYSK